MSFFTLLGGRSNKTQIPDPKVHCPMIVVFSSLTIGSPFWSIQEHLQMRKFRHFPWRIRQSESSIVDTKKYLESRRLVEDPGFPIYIYLLHDLWKQNFWKQLLLLTQRIFQPWWQEEVTGHRSTPSTPGFLEWGDEIFRSTIEIERISNYLYCN